MPKAKAQAAGQKPAVTGKHPGGRPSSYSRAVGEQICEYILENLGLPKIEKMPGMPSTTTIMRWLQSNEEFREMYARAKAEQAELNADAIREIADEIPPLDQNGRVDSGWVQWQKNRIEARKWVAAKLKPRVYGDRMDIKTEVSGKLEHDITVDQAKAIAQEFLKAQDDT